MLILNAVEMMWFWRTHLRAYLHIVLQAIHRGAEDWMKTASQLQVQQLSVSEFEICSESQNEAEVCAIAEEDPRQDELDEYYSRGSHFGVPASVTLFQLAHTMQLGSPYVLWSASESSELVIL